MRGISRPADVRGTNYYLSTSYAIEKTALASLRKSPASVIEFGTDGFFSASHNASELAVIRDAGFNNVRAWGSFWAWVADRRGYLATLGEFTGNCRRAGLSVTWVLWNTVHTAADVSEMLLPQSSALWSNSNRRQPNPIVTRYAWGAAAEIAIAGLRAGIVPDGEPWLASGLADPGPRVMHEFESLAQLQTRFASFVNMMDQYLVDTAEVMDQPGTPIFSYDLFNEPDYDNYFTVRRQMYADVIARSYQILSSTHRAVRPHYTVGFAGLDRNGGFLRDLVRNGVGLTYVSSHAYRTVYRMQDFTDTIRRHSATASQMGMDYVCSEFWFRFLAYPLPAPVVGYLHVLRAQMPRVGGQMWCFLETNLFEREVDDPRHYVPRPAASVNDLASPIPVPVDPPLPDPLPPRIRFPRPEAFDGVRRPMRGQWLPLSVSPVWPAHTTIRTTGSQSDLDAIRLWSMS